MHIEVRNPMESIPWFSGVEWKASAVRNVVKRSPAPYTLKGAEMLSGTCSRLLLQIRNRIWSPLQRVLSSVHNLRRTDHESGVAVPNAQITLLVWSSTLVAKCKPTLPQSIQEQPFYKGTPFKNATFAERRSTVPPADQEPHEPKSMPC